MYRTIPVALFPVLLLASALPVATADHAIAGTFSWAYDDGAGNVAFTYDEIQPGAGTSKLRVRLGDGRIACLDGPISHVLGPVSRTGYLSPAYAGCNPLLKVGSFPYLVERSAPLGIPMVTVEFTIHYETIGLRHVEWMSTGGGDLSFVEGETYLVSI